MPPVGKATPLRRRALAARPRLWQDRRVRFRGKTMRWILLLIAVLGFGLGFSAKAPGLMGLGFVLGFVFLIATFFAFAAERVAETSRPDSILLTDKDLNALRASMRKPPSNPA